MYHVYKYRIIFIVFCIILYFYCVFFIAFLLCYFEKQSIYKIYHSISLALYLRASVN